VKRSIITIRPRFEGGYDVYRNDEWAGSALTLAQVQAVAHRKAQEEADGGQIGLVVLQDMRGDLQSVVEWVDPSRDVVTIPDPVESGAPDQTPSS
jgi:hypothetical protein